MASKMMSHALWFFVPFVAASNLKRSNRANTEVVTEATALETGKHLSHWVADEEPVSLDFSDLPFVDSILHQAVGDGLHQAVGDPYKTNPKDGKPWVRYTKVSGRGQANHTHFDGLTATGDFPEDILHSHNVVRERAGVAPLEWSSKLGEMASARVLKLANEGCYIEHSPLKERWYEASFEYIGENLYKVINMKPTGVDIVDAWYAEIEDYSFGQVGTQCVKQKCAGRASPPCTLGHFTQVMWSKSTHVGCARAECPDQAKRTFISVCNYGEGGNIVGRYPFPALASGKMGLSKSDCTYQRAPAEKPESAWDEMKEGKMPKRSGAWRQASTTLAITLATVLSALVV